MLTGKYEAGEDAPRGHAARGVGADGRASSRATRSSTSVERLAAYAEDHGHTLPELALSWLAGTPTVGERDRGRDVAGAGAGERRGHRPRGSCTDAERAEVDALATASAAEP